MLAPLPALAVAAAATRRLRMGTMVLNNDFRHPVVLAREAATLDLLSDGRLELGLGAGHMKVEYDEAGLPFDRGRVRVERLAEAVVIVKRLFTGEPVTYAGRHYRVTDHTIHPRPVQRPRPPILIGGNGPRLLTPGRHRGRHRRLQRHHLRPRWRRAGLLGIPCRRRRYAAASRAGGRRRPLRSARAECAATAGDRHRRSSRGRRGAGAALGRGHGRRRARQSLRTARIRGRDGGAARRRSGCAGASRTMSPRRRTPTPWRRPWPVSPDSERTLREEMPP